MSYKLFLDDIREIKYIYPDANLDEWILARSYDEFVKIIEENGLPSFCSLDNDISSYNKDGNEMTGSDAAKFLVYYAFDNDLDYNANYAVHSSNPAGRLNIESHFETYKKIKKIY